MPDAYDHDFQDQLRGRYGVALPVIRPIPARGLVAGLSLIVLSLSLFGFYAEYGRKEVVPAMVAPVGGEARVLNVEPAVVTGIKVRVGQAVAEGSVLATVRGAERMAQPQAVQALMHSLDSRIASLRLRSQLTMQEAQGARQDLQRQLALLSQGIDQGTAELRFRDEVVATLSDELQRRQPLVEHGAVSDSAYDGVAMQLASAQASALAAGRELSGLRARHALLRAERQTLATRLAMRQAEQSEELALLQAERARAAALLAGEITAPVNGVVSALAISVGQTLTSGQLVAVVSPKGAPAEVVLSLPATAVGVVKPGLPVFVRLDAYPFETYGHVHAVVRSVEATAAVPQPAHEGPRVRALAAIKDVPPGVSLQSGMSGQAAVEVDRRTMLSWVLWPLWKNFSH